jgi:hypothetical protein
VKMFGESPNTPPVFVRSIVVTIDCSINRFPFPVETVSTFQLQREPNLNETILTQRDSQFIDICDLNIEHNLVKFNFCNILEPFNIDEPHPIPSRRRES